MECQISLPHRTSENNSSAKSRASWSLPHTGWNGDLFDCMFTIEKYIYYRRHHYAYWNMYEVHIMSFIVYENETFIYLWVKLQMIIAKKMVNYLLLHKKNPSVLNVRKAVHEYFDHLQVVTVILHLKHNLGSTINTTINTLGLICWTESWEYQTGDGWSELHSSLFFFVLSYLKN